MRSMVEGHYRTMRSTCPSTTLRMVPLPDSRRNVC
jgi:hypothetical protein